MLIAELALTRNSRALQQKSDFKLLNCMSESVIVLESRSKNIVRFASESAVHILYDEL